MIWFRLKEAPAHLGGTSVTNKFHANPVVNDLFIWVDMECHPEFYSVYGFWVTPGVSQTLCLLHPSICERWGTNRIFSWTSTVEIPVHRTHSLSVFLPILSYINLFKVSVLMEKQVQWVCGHECGETGGEQRQMLGVRTDPGWTPQLCVLVPKGQGLAC